MRKLALINRLLPFELLADIFTICHAEQLINLDECEIPVESTICSVCSRWRQVALATPKLWSVIRLGRPSTDTYLTRSKNCPIHVTWMNFRAVDSISGSFHNPPEPWDCLTRSIQQASRWKTLSLASDNALVLWELVERLNEVSVPNLDFVKIHLDSLDDWIPGGGWAIPLFEGDPESLKKVELLGLPEGFCAPIFTQLTTLCIQAPQRSYGLFSSDLHAALESSEHLETLILRRVVSDFRDGDLVDYKIDLPSLRKLVLDMEGDYADEDFPTNMLSLINAPDLHFLHLISLSHAQAFRLFSSTSNPKEPLFPRLQAFDFRQGYGHANHRVPHFIDFLQSIPSINRLVLQHESFSQIIKFISEHEDFLPQLKDITFECLLHFVSKPTEPCPSILLVKTFVELRQNAGFSLTRVSLPSACITSNPETVGWLRKNVEVEGFSVEDMTAFSHC